MTITKKQLEAAARKVAIAVEPIGCAMLHIYIYPARNPAQVAEFRRDLMRSIIRAVTEAAREKR